MAIAQQAKQSVNSATDKLEPAATRVRGEISDSFNMLATAAITLFITIFVVGMIGDTMETGEDHLFGSEFDQVVDITGDAFLLAGVALIVVVASVILWLVRGFGGNGGRRV